jgi:riboflavin synthase
MSPMFNGIVETVATIDELISLDGCSKITLNLKQNFDDLKIGDSLAVNGVCLTLTHINPLQVSAVIMPQTWQLTNLKNLQLGSMVNIERPLQVGSRIGGHYVQGHIDGVGIIVEIEQQAVEARLIKIQIPTNLSQYIVNKGYIAIDGMSITVVESKHDWFSRAFIPYTQANTIAHQYKLGTMVNVEVDIIGKMVEKFVRLN